MTKVANSLPTLQCSGTIGILGAKGRDASVIETLTVAVSGFCHPPELAKHLAT